jgi:hypothetical protein
MNNDSDDDTVLFSNHTIFSLLVTLSVHGVFGYSRSVEGKCSSIHHLATGTMSRNVIIITIIIIVIIIVIIIIIIIIPVGS